MDSPTPLPPTHRVLHLTSRQEPLTVITRPTPSPGPGSAIVRILAASILSYSRDIYTGARPYPFPTPLVPGASAIGRIAAVGPDATTLSPGQLVLCDITIRGRDDADAVMLAGIAEGFGAGARKLMAGPWRDGTYGEHARLPLENCLPLDEARLVGELGYGVEDLLHVAEMLVAFGGLDDVGLRAGETVVVAPATGKFGGAAVHVALAMGARVVAMGRNVEALARLEELGGGRVSTVPITGDGEAETAALRARGPVDVFFDISPGMAAKSSHIRSGIDSVRRGGRVSLMGGVQADLSFDYFSFMRKNLTMKGTWMFTREQALRLIQMVTAGILPLGPSRGLTVVAKYGFDQWQEAFDAAARHSGPGEAVVFVP
ncbi:alcohol dehydrogenase [Neofusicoccum parvum]|uniref:Alcohol dehydrogenase n=1 Tax=Neofusicoccum parvum TaxID=310453 RepID=A0ACB5S5L8_9PEZI|nr:alcohol dehydrogenase [Neofusicoccum parvum]